MNRRMHCVLVALALSHALVFAQKPGDAALPRHITLHEAVELALRHNHNVRIAGYTVEEKQHAKEVAKSAYFPSIRNDSSFLHLTDTQLIEIFGGWSLTGVIKGVYMMSNMTPAFDESNAYSIVTDEARIADVEALLRDFKSKTTQEAIYFEVVYNTDVRFL